MAILGSYETVVKCDFKIQSKDNKVKGDRK